MGKHEIRNNEVIQQLGKNLRSLRSAKGYSQEELAYQANVSLSQVARIERGKINTTISTIYALARALQIETSALVKNI